MMLRKTLVCLPVLFLIGTSVRLEISAQIKPVYDQGALGLVQLVKRLNTSASALMIGAHPDDEDTALLAYLVRGENARTAYLSLTRGDGGQNIIGPELGEALGVIRTEELLQARKLDGAEQYFTRAYDYGFSKTLDEAKHKWDEKIILCDVVRVIREFRPLVAISQFTGTPADGHGQHQYAGYISPLAVKAAADPAQCTADGPIWQVSKSYVRHRGGGDPTLRINTGKYNSLLGRSYFEIAMEARSQHRSQEQGVLELKGAQYSQLDLAGSDVRETGIFDGVDVSVSGVSLNTKNDEPTFGERIQALDAITKQIASRFDPRKPADILPLLVQGYQAAYDAEWATRIPASKFEMHVKQEQFVDAVAMAAGIQIDALADQETVTPGEALPVSVKVFTADPSLASLKEIDIEKPSPFTVTKAEQIAEVSRGFRGREIADHQANFVVTAPSSGFLLTQPYWLTKPRSGDVFEWPSDRSRTQPFDRPALSAKVTMTVAGKDLTFERPVEYRYADDTRGEVRREVNIVPQLSVDADQNLLVVPLSKSNERQRLTVSITSNSSEATGRLILGSPKLNFSRSADFSLKRKGEKASFSFDVAMPRSAKPGKYTIGALVATRNGSTYSPSMREIAYPHIQTHRIYSPFNVSVQLIDVKVDPVRVGYIMGSGDKIADAIRQMGIGVEIVTENELAEGDLSKFDTIVVGIRAYQVRPDLVANNKRLLDFANNGGNLIVLYQLSGYAQQSLMPYPAQMGPRVADENAKVTILQPEHPIFNTPNKISDADFEGWVQERNLYNFSTMDPKYTGLLESHDAGEAENSGGLVAADVGKGHYIYCSYSLFRQLPAGVPGAYRLLANLLAFSKLKK